MGERLYFFWLRFRWLIVIAALLVALGGGALLRIAGPSLDSGTEQTTGTTVATGTVETVTAESLLAACAGLEDTAVYECRAALPQAMPLVLSADRSSFIAGDAWRNGDGDLAPIAGLDAGATQRISSGFTADLDNDGYLEHVLVTGEVGKRTMHILTGSTVESLVDTAAVRGVSGTEDINMAAPFDINRDGWLDIVVAYRNPRTPQSGADSSGGVGLYLNNGWAGPGTFSSDLRRAFVGGSDNQTGGERGQVLREAVDMQVTDVDDDGNLDLIVVDRKSVLRIFWGSSGELKNTKEITEAYVGENITLVRVPMGVTGIDTTDADGDGKTDIVASYDISIGSVTRSLCVAETNNRPCTMYPEISADGGLAVLLQGGDRDFSPAPALSVPGVTFASDVHAADLDGDGREELVLGREPLDDDGEPSVLVYRAELDGGKVVGYRAADTAIPGDLGPVARISAFDTDGNGTLDLIFSGRGKERTQTWTNPADAIRHLRLRFEGSARADAIGTSRTPIGVVVVVRDVDETERRIVLGDNDAHNELVVALPLQDGVWSGTENVPQVKVTFPATGRIVELKGVAVNKTLVISEPGK